MLVCDNKENIKSVELTVSLLDEPATHTVFKYDERLVSILHLGMQMTTIGKTADQNMENTPVSAMQYILEIAVSEVHTRGPK